MITFFLGIDPLATNCLLSFGELYQIPSLIFVERFLLFIYCLFLFYTFYTLNRFFVGVGDSIINHWKCISHHATLPKRFLDNPFQFTYCNEFLLLYGCWSYNILFIWTFIWIFFNMNCLNSLYRKGWSLKLQMLCITWLFLLFLATSLVVAC